MEKLNGTYPTFTLGDKLTEEQITFFNKHGFIQFKKFLQTSEVNEILAGLKTLQDKWISNDIKMINGVPINYGVDDEGNKIVHRFAFTSNHCPEVKNMVVNNPKLKELLKLLGVPNGRIGENEKDGVVVNQYINTGKSKMRQMGWHTDSLRDIFYGQKVMPMLNVGLYFTDSKKEQGGLRVLPGTHNQSMVNTLFRKPYFISSKPDKNELCIEAEAGDLTVHHGNIWHRVAMAPVTGKASKRITMYVPMIVGRFMPKSDRSSTPLYHKMRVFAKK